VRIFRLRKRKRASPALETGIFSPSVSKPARYLEIREIDNWRPVPFQVDPPPVRELVLSAVDNYVSSLRGALDEGTAPAVDPLIQSWVAGWIATVETEYADHSAVIHIHLGQAVQWLTDSTVLARHEREKFERIRADYLACRARLGGAAEHELGPHGRQSGEERPSQ
jgi:hypothetical protein